MRTPWSLLRLVPLFSLAWLAGACSSDSPSEPDPGALPEPDPGPFGDRDPGDGFTDPNR